MAVQLNHTIVHARDPHASARFLAEMLGRDDPVTFGPFQEVQVDNGVSLDFMAVDDEEIVSQHYAFLVSEEDFDATFARLTERGLDYFADPAGRLKGEINTRDGGRGVYWADPDGHWLEIITVPYGGWPGTTASG